MNTQLKDFVQVHANRLKKKIYQDDSIHIPDFDNPKFINRDDMLEYYLITFNISREEMLTSIKREVIELRRIITAHLKSKGFSLEDIGYILHRKHATIIYYLESRSKIYNQKNQHLKQLLK